jgi:hypothetical protein
MRNEKIMMRIPMQILKKSFLEELLLSLLKNSQAPMVTKLIGNGHK